MTNFEKWEQGLTVEEAIILISEDCRYCPICSRDACDLNENTCWDNLRNWFNE